MGLGLVLLFWLAIAAVIGAIWLASLGLWLCGLARHSRALAWLGGVPLALSSAAGALWALFMLWAIILIGWEILGGLLGRA